MLQMISWCQHPQHRWTPQEFCPSPLELPSKKLSPCSRLALNDLKHARNLSQGKQCAWWDSISVSCSAVLLLSQHTTEIRNDATADLVAILFRIGCAKALEACEILPPVGGRTIRGRHRNHLKTAQKWLKFATKASRNQKGSAKASPGSSKGHALSTRRSRMPSCTMACLPNMLPCNIDQRLYLSIFAHKFAHLHQSWGWNSTEQTWGKQIGSR